MKTTRLLLLTGLAMVAFASNSLLCRLALRSGKIDPATFTSVRLLSGAIALLLVVALTSDRSRRNTDATHLWTRSRRSWIAAFALFIYAAGFSFAYLQLPAGIGALLLFGTVQATMVFFGLAQGERLSWRQLIGLAFAMIGLVILLSPGITAPPLLGSTLMILAGIAWGVYSLLGRKALAPTHATATNFSYSLPFTLLLSVAAYPIFKIDWTSFCYAIISGAISSAIGYILWYAVLAHLKSTIAATVQLSVPVLTAACGILFLGEAVTFRYLLASVTVLGGIALVVMKRSPA